MFRFPNQFPARRVGKNLLIRPIVAVLVVTQTQNLFYGLVPSNLLKISGRQPLAEA